MARSASALTASTIDIRPRPLPIEMFWRKTRSTRSGVTVATSSAGRPDSVLSRIVASAFAEMPDGFSTAKWSCQRAVRPRDGPGVGLGLALRDQMCPGERTRRDLGRDLAKRVSIADEQIRTVGRVVEHRKGVNELLEFRWIRHG